LLDSLLQEFQKMRVLQLLSSIKCAERCLPHQFNPIRSIALWSSGRKTRLYDGVSSDYELVYKQEAGSYLTVAKYSFIGTSTCLVVGGVHKIFSAITGGNIIHSEMWTDGFVPLAIFLGFNVVLFYLLLTRLPVRMYYSEEKKEYLLINLSLSPFPNTFKKVVIEPGTVHIKPTFLAQQDLNIFSFTTNKWHVTPNGTKLMLYKENFRSGGFYLNLLANDDDK